jgi:uncharacterized protein YciI
MEMVTVYLGLLRRGPRAAEWDERPHELEQLQEAHLANIRRMYEIGKLLIAGPCTDNGDLRGVYVFKTESLAEAEALAQSDPSVQAGRLWFEFHPWMIPSGVLAGA